MGLATRRPAAVGGVVLALAAAGAMLALGLEPSADTSTVVGKSTQGYEATQTLHRRFGDDAIYVSVREPVARVVLTEDLNTVLGPRGLPVRERAGRAHAARAAERSLRAAGARPSRRASCSGRGRSSTRPSRRSRTASAR